jgi:crossover junction endodeoxyribonuclease RuvC
MGWAVLDMNGNHFKAVDYGSILTDAGVPMPDRLLHLYAELTAIIEQYQPEEASIEELFFNNNAKTALSVGHARGVILLAGAHKGVPISEYTPLQVKQSIVGYGRADKKQMQYMVKTMLNMKEIPKPDDAADALAIAMCHGQWNKNMKA